MAVLLAQAGEPFNERIHFRTKNLIEHYSEEPIFSLAVVESLIWARYAKDKKRFFDLALNYLRMEDDQVFKEAKNLAWRFGPESLKTILRSWKSLLDELRPVGLPQHFSSKELAKFQQDYVLTKANKLVGISRLSQIGPWVFCGPFKILAAYRRDLWSDPGLDDVWMSLGFQVIQGLRFLSRQGFKDINLELLNEEEPGLIAGLGTVVLAQKFQKKLADFAESRVLHINSGLFELGKRESDG